MPLLQSTPPLRATTPVIVALTILSLRLWAPAVQQDPNLPAWRAVLGALAAVAAISLTFWLAQGRWIKLHETTLEVRRLGLPWRTTQLPIDKLRGITTFTEASFGFDVTFLAFEGCKAVPLPAYYTNAAPLLWLLKAKLSVPTAANQINAT